MELGKHLEKGVWAIADKGMIALYGVFMLVVIRVLPQQEFGNYLLIQYTFLILSNLSVTLGMAPYVKYYYDTDDRLELQSIGLSLVLGFYFTASALLAVFLHPLGLVLKSQDFVRLFYFVPLLFIAAFGKLFAGEIFRATYKIQQIFWIDVLYYLLNIGLIVVFILQNRFQTARLLLQINLAAYGFSSLLGLWLVRHHLYLRFKIGRQWLARAVHFGKYAFGAAATSAVYERSDSYIISALLGPQAVALIGAVKIFLRPFDLYRQAIALIAFPAFARLHSEGRKQDIRSLYEKGIFLSYLGLVPMVLILLIGANLFFEVILAGKYPAGPAILRVFSFLGLMVCWQSIGEGVLFGIGEARYPFISRAIATISSVVLNIVLISYFGVIGAAFATLFSIGLLATLTTIFVNRKMGVSFRGIFSRHGDLVRFVQNRVFDRRKSR